MEYSNEVAARQTARTRHLLYLLTLFILVLVLDLLTKHLILTDLELGESVQVVGNTVRLTYILNPGGVFGVSIGSNVVYLIVSLIVIAVVIYTMWRRLANSKIIDFSLAAVVGGAVGNFIDRLRFGAVVDFLDVNIPDIDIFGISMQRWPIFNVADAAVTVGMIVIILTLLFSRTEIAEDPNNSDGSREN
jgi:signal peptidase II